MYVLNSFPLILTADLPAIRNVTRTDNDGVCVFKNYMHVSKVFHDIYCLFQKCVGSWEVYSIQHYMLKFVSDLLQVVGFPPVSSTNHSQK